MTEHGNEKRQELEALVGRILEVAAQHGASDAEVAASEHTGLSVTARAGDVETVEFNQDRGFGVTVYFGGRKGSASTSDASAAAIEDTVRAACNIARYTEEDAYAGLESAERMAKAVPDLDLYHPEPFSAEDAIARALACEQAAMEADPRIRRSDGATSSAHTSTRAYGNSRGFIGSQHGTRWGLSCMVISQGDTGGMQRDYWYTTARRLDDLEQPRSVGLRAAARAVARLNPRKAPTGTYPVLFAPEVSGGLLSSLIGALSGGALYRKASFLLDSLGREVMPARYSVAESPHEAGAMGSSAFDGDGVATRAQAFVADGVVASYVLGTYSARRLGLVTTGNASGVHNLDIQGPTVPADDLRRDMGTGFLVTEMMGQGVNMVTGDYSRGAAGFWVENGEIAYPVEEATIASNLADMLMHVAAVGDDRDMRGNVRAPSILVDGMTVAGIQA